MPFQPRWSWLLPLGIGLLAFAVRWTSVADVGGLHALLGYDEGVYMGAATALTHGLLPYRDFTLVHPPGSTVLLTPFALLGRATSESGSWAVARVAIMALGGLNAALITIVARRISVIAAVSAGLLYALWGPVVHVERTTMLEAFVLAGLVIALVALRRPDETVTRAVIAGTALGLGTSVKLWGAIPLAVIVCWLLVHRAWRTAAWVTGASAAAFALVVAPFLIATGGRLVQLVVFAQLGRGEGGTAPSDRLARILSIDATSATAALPRVAVLAGAALVVATIVLVMWRRPAGRLWAALLVVQGAVLLVVPVYFTGYSSFVAPALALVTATAVDVAWRDVTWRPLRIVTATTSVLVLTAMVAAGATHVLNDGDSVRGPDPRVSSLVAAAPCVSSDATGVLLMYDALGRSIDHGCTNPLIDVDGTVYAVQQANPGHLSSSERRRQSLAYQDALQRYFAEGDVVLMHRTRADELNAETASTLTDKGLSLDAPGLRVFGGISPP